MASMLLFPICFCLMLRALRERFRLQGKVKAANAVDSGCHGERWQLFPVFTLAGLLAVAPGYLQTMATGGWTLGSAVLVQVAAGLAIKKFTG